MTLAEGMEIERERSADHLLIARKHRRFWMRLARRDAPISHWEAAQLGVDHVAAQLSVDRRTLHRRLAREKQTFSGIVETVRTEIVARTLPSRERPLTVVADMLGFGSLSAFSRWFRTQFRTSPTRWRERHHRRGATP